MKNQAVWDGFTGREDYIGKEMEWKKKNLGTCIFIVPGSPKSRWVQAHGPIPRNHPPLWILHKCDWKNCKNVAHMFLGTHSENTHDWWVKIKGDDPFLDKNAPENQKIMEFLKKVNSIKNNGNGRGKKLSRRRT